MKGSTVILAKELAENFSSRRFMVIFALIFLSGSATAYLGYQELARAGISGFEDQEVFLVLFSGAASPIPSFIFFMGMLAPILGIALGFDAINRENSSGSMVRLLSNPIYRDSILVGKVVAGLMVITLVIASIIGIILGVSILLAGFGPNIDSALRIFYFAIASILYAGVWLGISLFFSTIFRRIATSALAALSLWILLSFFMPLIASIVSRLLVPVTFFSPIEQVVFQEEVRLAVSRISPGVIFTEIANALLNPRIRTLGPFYVYSPDLPSPTPLAIDATLALIWPHMAALFTAVVLFSTLSYVAFMRMEIRAKWE